MMAILCLTAHAEEFRLIVAGLGGEPDYETRFATLSAEAARLTGAELLSGAAATKAALQAAIGRIAARARAEDTVTLVLIGHGTFDGVAFKFNLPGPDVSAVELRAWMDALPARQLVVVSSSASGAAVATLKAPARGVIAATRSGNEKNAVVFSRYFVDALRDTAADSDKDDAVSAGEAFEFARQKVAAYYETQKRLATEHPVYDDAGARFILARFGSAQRALDNPLKRALLARRERVESQIDLLKLGKAAMPVEEYKKRLAALLLDLARLQEEIEK